MTLWGWRGLRCDAQPGKNKGGRGQKEPAEGLG